MKKRLFEPEKINEDTLEDITSKKLAYSIDERSEEGILSHMYIVNCWAYSTLGSEVKPLLECQEYKFKMPNEEYLQLIEEELEIGLKFAPKHREDLTELMDVKNWKLLSKYEKNILIPACKTILDTKKDQLQRFKKP